MAKLEFVYNKIQYVLDSGCTYIGLHSPFSIGATFQLVKVIPDCNYGLIRDYNNGDDESTGNETCTKCIEKGLNYRVEYQYCSDGTIKIRARHRIEPNVNFKLVNN